MAHAILVFSLWFSVAPDYKVAHEATYWTLEDCQAALNVLRDIPDIAPGKACRVDILAQGR